MKVLVVVEWYYDSCTPLGAYLVPKDVDETELRQKWNEETRIPLKGKNQFGEWTSKNYGAHTIPFETWLSKTYDRLEVEFI